MTDLEKMLALGIWVCVNCERAFFQKKPKEHSIDEDFHCRCADCLCDSELIKVIPEDLK